MHNEDFRVAAGANPALKLISIIETRSCKFEIKRCSSHIVLRREQRYSVQAMKHSARPIADGDARAVRTLLLKASITTKSRSVRQGFDDKD